MSIIKKIIKTTYFILSISLSLQAAYGASGDVDTSFNAYLTRVPSGVVSRTIIQPDGKIIACGEFPFVNGFPRTNIVRFNTDGTVDATFNPPPIPTTGAGHAIQSIALQPDGKIVIAGQFSNPRSGLARLNADGSPDTTFNTNAGLNNVWIGVHVKIAPDGKIVFWGTKLFTSTAREYLMRLNVDGSLDREDQFIRASRFVIQPDLKIVYYDSNIGSIRRINTDFSEDVSFSPVSVGGVDMVLQPDGKLVIGGGFTQVNGGNLRGLARINTDGTVDTTFNIGTAGPNTWISSVVLLPSGKMYVGGSFTMFNGVPKPRIALINADGTLDESFTAIDTFTIFSELDVQTDGKIIVSGHSLGASVPSPIVRLNTDGSLDNTFQTVIGEYGRGNRTLVQPDNKILVSGEFNYTNGASRQYLARFNADGTLDIGFNPAITAYSGGPFDIFSDGKIAVRGDSGLPSYRLNSDGTLDITYVNALEPNDIKTLPDGKVLFAKIATVQRNNTDGTVDGTFSVPTVDGYIDNILLQPDGKILIAGNFANVNGVPRGMIARLNADGTVDASFNPPGGANNTIMDMGLQPDGKVLVAGEFTSINFNANRKYLARLNPDGNLDANFVPAIDGAVYAARLQADGKVLVGGAFSAVNGVARWRYARLLSNGNLDNTFPVGSGASHFVRDIDLQSDGKIIMVGDFSYINGSSRTGIVRLLNPPSVPRVLFDYDGDGKADVSVFRPSENRWYVLKSSDLTVLQQVFAIPGDVPVPADYDGDGKTDFAIFRPSSGDWWSLSSLNGQQVFAHWGASGDVPRPSDFDGDGRADYVVFRPSNNFWYRISSANGAASNQAFGLAGDKPVIADFDGDGKSDKAIYRPSTGDWWWQSSVDNVQRATHWGISTDVPAPADFDGDGKTDFAVYRPSTGIWYIFNSSDFSATIINFGLAEDKPVAADYDGDGRADIAVFRPSTGVWYLLQSTNGFWGLYFGLSNDIPTENAFVP